MAKASMKQSFQKKSPEKHFSGYHLKSNV